MQTNIRSDAVATRLPLDPAGRIAQDIPCIHCGYNLRSLLPEQACPECGAAVEPSLRGDALQFSDPRWLKRLAIGMTCILAGGIAFVASVCGIRWLEFWLSSVLGIPEAARSAIIILLCLGIPAVGLWLATWPEPGRIAASRTSKVRTAARVLAVAALVVVLSGTLSPVGSRTRPATLSDIRWMNLRESLWCLLNSAAWSALCIHISPLSRRAGAPRLARFTLLAAVGLALSGLVAAGIRVWLGMHIRQQLAASPSSLYQTLMTIGTMALVLGQVLIFLLAIPYLRLFRRQRRLAQGAMHEPGTAAVT